LREEWVGHAAEPLDRFTVRGHDRRGGAVTFDDEFVDVGGVERVECLEREVVDDQQVDAQQFADLDVVTVVESRRAEPFEHPVAAFEVHAVTTADRGVAERGGEERLADSDWSHDHRVVAAVDEPK